jgi:hypothetical protein
MDRRLAVRQALIAQAGCVALAGVAVAVAVLGMPGLPSKPVTPELQVPSVEVPTGPKAGEAARRPVDGGAVAARLTLVSNHPKAPEAAPTERPVEAGPATPPAETRYLGAMGVGRSLMGLISEGGKQKFVKVGSKLADGSTVVEITERRLVTEDEAGQKTYDLTGRSSDVLTRGSATPGMPRTAAIPPGGARGAQPIPAVAVQPVTPPPSAISMSKAVAAARNAKGGKGGMRQPGEADGTPERFEEIVSEMRKSSNGQLNEDDIMQKAKAMFEEETLQAQNKGNK